MARRDQAEQGGRRAARRGRMPDFLYSDDADGEELDDGGLLSGMKARARHHYDERQNLDDMDGVEDVRIQFIHYMLH